MDKEEDVVHTQTHTHRVEYYSAIKKNKTLPFATMRMEFEGIMLSAISQKKINITWSLTHGNWKNLGDMEDRLVVTRGADEVGGQ